MGNGEKREWPGFNYSRFSIPDSRYLGASRTAPSRRIVSPFK